MPVHQTTDSDRVVIAKYLLEAHGKERQLETALQAQIVIARRPGLEHALRDHLAVTRDQIDAIEHRLVDLGHDGSRLPGFAAAEAVVGLVSTVANKSLALAKGPLQALRGTSAADNDLRLERDCYWNEAEEIAHYRVIETVAEEIGDIQTAALARKHRAEEEEMQATLEDLLPGLVRAVVGSESPDHEELPDRPRPVNGAKPTVAAASTAKPATTGKRAAPTAGRKASTRAAATGRGSATKPAPRKAKPTTAASTRRAAAAKTINS